jgi:hypothetical protein
MPPVTLWEERAARRLFPDTRWETLLFEHVMMRYDGDPGVEHTLRVRVRKLDRS